MAQAASFTVAEDAAVVNGAVTATDADVGATFTFALNDAAPAGLTFNSNGSYSFNPADAAYQSLGVGQQTIITVPYTVTDNAGATSTANLVITVTGTNDAPVAVADTGALADTEHALVIFYAPYSGHCKVRPCPPPALLPIRAWLAASQNRLTRRSACSRAQPALAAVAAGARRQTCPAPGSASHLKSSMASSAAWPPDAAWYRPQMARPCCPHCHTFLTDLSQFTPWQNAGVFGVVVCAQLFVTPGWARAQVLGATLLLALGLKAWRLRQVRGKPRFVPWASR